MAMTVRRKKDARTPLVVMHRVADIRGGVSVKTSELGGKYLREGTVVSAPVDGVVSVVKTAKILETVEGGSAIKVEKGHHFKVGDVVMTKEGSVALAITDIAEKRGHSLITVDDAAAMEAEVGELLCEALAESAGSDSALKYEPFAIVGTTKKVVSGDNLDVDAWVMAVTKGNDLPAFIADKLKGVINY